MLRSTLITLSFLGIAACAGPGSGPGGAAPLVIPDVPTSNDGGTSTPGSVPDDCPLAGLGQLSSSVPVEGTVTSLTDRSNGPIDGAEVTLFWEGGCQRATSDAEGTFTVDVPDTIPFAVSGAAAGHVGAYTVYSGLEELTWGGLTDPLLGIGLQDETILPLAAQQLGITIDPTKGSVGIVFRLDEPASPEGYGLDLDPASGVAFINTPDGGLEQGNQLITGNSIHLVTYYNVDPGDVRIVPLTPSGKSCTVEWGGVWPVKASTNTRATVECQSAL